MSDSFGSVVSGRAVGFHFQDAHQWYIVIQNATSCDDCALEASGVTRVVLQKPGHILALGVPPGLDCQLLAQLLLRHFLHLVDGVCFAKKP